MKHPTQGNNALKPEGRYTYADYKTWPEGERWELIDGVPYSMSPAPRRKHQDLFLQLGGELDRFFAGKSCRPYASPIDVFWSNRDDPDDEDTVTQPDLLVVCDKSKLIDEGIRGAPDFIIEILSPGTAFKDQTEKRVLHEKHGVREYWIVNPDTFETFIYTLGSDDAYDLPRSADIRKSVPVSIFPGLVLFIRTEDL
ncbi:MAG: Uma2 family endonuclease [Treponemataceae bacterium]